MCIRGCSHRNGACKKECLCLCTMAVQEHTGCVFVSKSVHTHLSGAWTGICGVCACDSLSHGWLCQCVTANPPQ